MLGQTFCLKLFSTSAEWLYFLWLIKLQRCIYTWNELSHCSQLEFMIWFIVVFEGYYISEVFGAYVTFKIGYWQKESSCFLNDYFAKTCFYNGCRIRTRAKILTTFLIEAWCLTGRWPSKQRGICWKLGRSFLIKALYNLARQTGST